MSNFFMSTGNNKTSYPNIFRLYFTDKIDLRGNKKNKLYHTYQFITLGIT